MLTILSFDKNFAHYANGMAVMFFVLTSVHLYKHKNKNGLMKFFFWEMVCLAFIELINSVYLIEGVWEMNYVQNITFSSDMWCIPLVTIFVFEIISPGWIRWYKIVAMMLPSVLFTFLYIIFPSAPLFYTAVIYGNLLGLVTVIIVVLASSKYDQYIKHHRYYLRLHRPQIIKLQPRRNGR